MTPLERAARALHAELGMDWPYTYDDGMKDYARAILAAIREPSEEMVDAGGEKVFSGSRSAAQVGVYNAWQAMIDAALGEG